MKVISSELEMQTNYLFSQEISQTQQMTFWFGKHPPPLTDPATGFNDARPDQLTLSPAAQLLGGVKEESVQAVNPEQNKDVSPLLGDPKLDILISVIEALTGKRVRLISPEEFFSDPDQPANRQGAAPDSSSQAPTAPAKDNPDPGYGFAYTASQTITQSESLTISASGTLNTAQGQEINFDLELNLSQTFVQSQEINILGGNALQDPLIVNYSGESSQLTEQTFSFDLDLDMQTEQIPFPGPGSGFLALDKNKDGKINNGQELFGPKTGHGFKELTAYDLDKNNWIDENDPVFPLLKVWSKDEKGNDQLFSLGKIGIGAISLAPLVSPFHIGGKNLKGILASSGLFIKNNGQPGLVQEVHLKV